MHLRDVGRLLFVLRGRRAEHTTDRGPLVLAGALIHDGAGRFLLIHRNTPSMTWWEVPGGKVEAGENLWEAASRELAEELNAIVEPIEEIGTGDFDHDGQPLRYTWYIARLVDGEPAVMETDRFDAMRYFTPSEVAKLDDASPSLRRLFELHADQLDGIAERTDKELASS